MVPNTPPPSSDKEKPTHQNAGDAGEGDPRLLLNILNDGWISVKERLPEKGEPVLCFTTDRTVVVDSFYVTVGAPDNKAHWFNGDREEYNDRVTHWMPLPDPPKH